MGIVCCNQSLLKLKDDQLLRHLLNQFNSYSFSAPIGQILDRGEENRFKNITNPSIAGWRYFRLDTNQFYNLIFQCLIQEKEGLKYILEFAQKIQWQLYLKNQCIIENGNKIKEQFINITQDLSRNNLFEFLYTDLDSRFPYYVLSMIFMRNLIKLYLSEENKMQILDWNLKFDLQKEENITKIAQSLKIQITLYFIENNQIKVYGENISQNKIQVMAETSGLSIGLSEQQLFQETPSQFIFKLYKATSHARKVAVEQQKFVSENLDFSQLIEEYNLTAQMFQKIKLGGFKRVRGDGNCFYTTIVYQYLDLMINKSNGSSFQEFLEILKKLEFRLIHPSIPEMTENLQKSLKSKFLSILYEIRGSTNRQKQLQAEFSNHEGVFYALSIIYIKNLLYYLSELNHEHKDLLGAEAQNQIREWEEETDNIQVLVVILTLALKINLQFYYIDTENQTVELQNYNEDAKEWSLYMIFSPGHYCIGLPKISNKQS